MTFPCIIGMTAHDRIPGIYGEDDDRLPREPSNRGDDDDDPVASREPEVSQ